MSFTIACTWLLLKLKVSGQPHRFGAAPGTTDASTLDLGQEPAVMPDVGEAMGMRTGATPVKVSGCTVSIPAATCFVLIPLRKHCRRSHSHSRHNGGLVF